MRIQVLAAVMNQTPDKILAQMHIDSDAIFINQCDTYAYEEVLYRGHKVRFFSCAERGVGRSRNNAILRADSDICLFSDEDIVYEEGYKQAIAEEFEKNPKADMILFNIEVEETRRTYHISERKRVHWYNCGRYGAVSFAVRTEKLLASGVMFSLLFGGGAKYSNGEDSLFLKEFMDKGYKVYTAPVKIGREEADKSTWFAGYNEKFFYDRGVLYRCLYGGMAPVMALRFVIRQKQKGQYQGSIKEAFGVMIKGIREKDKHE